MTSSLSSPRLMLNLPHFMKPISLSSEKQSILKSDFKVNQPLNDNFHVILFERQIEISSKQTGRFKIPFDFENKFSIQGSCLQFIGEGDAELQLTFEKNEMEIWRRELGKRLCQKFKNVPFRIKKRISVRNLCAIYLAEQDRMQKGAVDLLAVKAFRKSSLGTGKAYEDFKNQISIMRNIRHPNLSKLQHVYQSDNSYYICMSHYEGGTLLDRHMKQALPFSATKGVLLQVLTGLSFLHNRGIVHRDIKPENILMQKNDANDIVIIDFGLAANLNDNSKLHLKCGTPGYVAPQIFKSTVNNPYDEQCDIFSTGILFFWLLTRKLPYSAKTEQQLKIENYSFCFQSRKYPVLDSCSHQAIDLLGRMLNRDPNSRITAEEALNHEFFQISKTQNCGKNLLSFGKEECKYSY